MVRALGWYEERMGEGFFGAIMPPPPSYSDRNVPNERRARIFVVIVAVSSMDLCEDHAS